VFNVVFMPFLGGVLIICSSSEWLMVGAFFSGDTMLLCCRAPRRITACHDNPERTHSTPKPPATTARTSRKQMEQRRARQVAKVVEMLDAAARDEAGFWAQWSQAQGFWGSDDIPTLYPKSDSEDDSAKSL